MSQSEWNTTDSIIFCVFYGVVGIAALTMGIAQLIEACRTRPKVQMMVLGVPKGKLAGKEDGVQQDESQSAAVNE